MLHTFNLQGKVALVTGCDKGLGQGMALGLAEAGCDIVSVSRRKSGRAGPPDVCYSGRSQPT